MIKVKSKATKGNDVHIEVHYDHEGSDKMRFIELDAVEFIKAKPKARKKMIVDAVNKVRTASTMEKLDAAVAELVDVDLEAVEVAK